MKNEEPRTEIRRALGLLVCLCILVQPLLVPLHLFMVEHCYDHQAANSRVSSHELAHARGLAHSHASHVHVHKHSDDHRHWPHEVLIVAASESDDAHPHHPAEEHFYEQSQLYTSASQQIEPLAAAGERELLAQLLAPVASIERPAPSPVELGPPRGSVQPRAPPAIV